MVLRYITYCLQMPDMVPNVLQLSVNMKYNDSHLNLKQARDESEAQSTEGKIVHQDSS
jgi:hypothetical protein